MKKELIAMMLSAVITAGSFGSADLYAAEPIDQGVPTEDVGYEDTQSEPPSDDNTAVQKESEAGFGQEEISGEAGTQEENAGEAGTQEEIAGESMTREEISGEAGTNEKASEGVSDTETEIAAVSEPATSSDANEAVTQEQAEIVGSGICGDNATWTLTVAEDDLWGSQYTLTISGSGDMYDYETTEGHWLISSVDRDRKRQMTRSAGINKGFLLSASVAGTSPWDQYFPSVNEVIIEDGITSIGDYAFAFFYNCSNVVIPDSVTRIGNYAFYNWSSLAELSLPGALTEIGDYAFSGCSRVTSILIPDGVIEIGDHAFRECSTITDISIPDGITVVKEGMFEDCVKFDRYTTSRRGN